MYRDDKYSMKLKSDIKKIALNAANPKKNLDDKICKNSDEMKYYFKSVLKTCVTEEFYNAIKVNSLKKKAKMKRNKGTYFRSVNLFG